MAQAKKALVKPSKKPKISRAGANKPAQKTTSRSAVKTYQNYIGGEWVDSASGESFENINPADTRDVIGTFPLSTRQDVNDAVNAAQEAFTHWRRTPAPRRAEILFRLGEILIRNKDRYAADMTREMGKVLKETGGDVQEAIDCTYYTAGEGRRLHGFTTPAEMPDKFAMCVRQPVGLCGLITPWNFPMAIPSWKLIPALVCGNTVVIKPAEDTPLSTYNLVKACEEAGIPPGVVNLVTGYGETVGAAMTPHPALRLISFTGSTETGRLVASACADRNAICSLEAEAGYPLAEPQPGYAVQDPAAVLDAVLTALGKVVATTRDAGTRITGVSFSSAMHSLIAPGGAQESLQAVFAEAG